MVDVVILVVGDLAQLAPQLALAIETNKLATCAFLFLLTNLTGIPANFLNEFQRIVLQNFANLSDSPKFS